MEKPDHKQHHPARTGLDQRLFGSQVGGAGERVRQHASPVANHKTKEFHDGIGAQPSGCRNVSYGWRVQISARGSVFALLQPEGCAPGLVVDGDCEKRSTPRSHRVALNSMPLGRNLKRSLPTDIRRRCCFSIAAWWVAHPASSACARNEGSVTPELRLASEPAGHGASRC